MTVSTFDLFKLGVGPSSSHTMGPMIAAGRFTSVLADEVGLERVARVTVTLYGSLALTGRGHATDRGVILGLMGFRPDTVDLDQADQALRMLDETGQLQLAGGRAIVFKPAGDIVWEGRKVLPWHANGLSFSAQDDRGAVLIERNYYSVGGGFVRDEREMAGNSSAAASSSPFEFTSAAELLQMAEAAGLTIANVMLANETAWRPLEEVEARLDEIFAAMEACIDRGLTKGGELPGGLRVRRRAAQVHLAVIANAERRISDPLAAMDWVNLWALAVNEENAAGGRVVTAPTNGAAGIIPAVLRFYSRCQGGTAPGRRNFLLTAAAIGALFKRNASISGAEVGCQGEVGVACSMAAAGLCAAMGGSNMQIENAAEIGMEHNLGLTCDPIGGLVQIPCIERNAMGAIKAIDAARLALLGDGQHSVSLDKVIATMKRTGEDMMSIYKETSLGGLALDIPVSRADC